MSEGRDDSVELGPAVVLPTEFGSVRVQHFTTLGLEGVLVTPPGSVACPTPVRIHSSCLFSEAFRATNCDCADQLHVSLRVVASEGGVLVYLYQEGRGAGLRLKTLAIKHQSETGCDTAEAFRQLGLAPDPRDHLAAAAVLKQHLGVTQPLALLTNNPGKIDALEAAGLHVVERRPLICRKNSVVAEYLDGKKDALGHLVDDDQQMNG